jgi:hypothetical protein
MYVKGDWYRPDELQPLTTVIQSRAFHFLTYSSHVRLFVLE